MHIDFFVSLQYDLLFLKSEVGWSYQGCESRFEHREEKNESGSELKLRQSLFFFAPNIIQIVKYSYKVLKYSLGQGSGC